MDHVLWKLPFCPRDTLETTNAEQEGHLTTTRSETLAE